MLKLRAVLAGLSVVAAALPFHAGVTAASAQTFTKQVTIIVPYAPGGTSDILARLLAPKLSEAIGQPVIVENKPTSSGNIGADFVAKAAGDGHTLLITDVGTLATQPNLVKKLSFEVQKDLVPVTDGDVLAVSVRGAPVRARRDAAGAHRLRQSQSRQAECRNQRRRFVQHLTALVIAKKYGLKWGIVPYRGGAAAIRAVVSNESNVIFNGALAT